MTSSITFRNFIIGQGTLPIQCAELLSQKGHLVCGIVTSDVFVSNWARERGIPTVEPTENLMEFFGETPFDFLFSIVNEHILSDEIVMAPRKYAINYHDAPLPKYAGTHSTSWALLNGEKSHGVTWHIISKQVDAGDILKQRVVAISPDDTAFTLNTKCYEAAIHSFAELVDELATGRALATKQDLPNRTFFPRYKRPVSGGVLSWNHFASEIADRVRALDFGPHDNPLGAAKILVGKDFVLVRSLGICEFSSTREPGNLLEVADDFLKVATVTRDVTLRDFSTIDGRPLTTHELADIHGLVEGQKLVEIDEVTAFDIDQLTAETCRHERFWVKKLSQLRPLTLPYATRNVTQRVSTQHVAMPIPRKVFATLNRQDTSNERADFILAAWSAYLSRISDVESFDLNFKDFTGRDATNKLDRLFASHVPLRIEINNAQNLSEFFSATRPTLEEVRRHKTFPRDITARYPKLHSLVVEKKELLPIAVEITDSIDDGASEDIGELTLRITRDGTACGWFYDPSKFTAVNIERMTRQFGVFLNGFAAKPESLISKLPLMTDEELQQVLVEWNRSGKDIVDQRCIHDLFEAQVERTPDATAVVVDQQRLTYKELNQRANRLARFLRNLGVGPETLVAICLNRSLELVVGLLGILKAGGAYVPLDSAYPQERLAFIIEDSNAPVIITQHEMLPKLPPHASKVVCLDSDGLEIDRESDMNLAQGASSSDLAYLIYTSGSTGRPKGVAIEHRNTVALIDWAQTVFSREDLSGVLASTSICFDLSVFELFVPLSYGGKVIVAENALHLATLPAAREVRLVNTVPSAMAELLRMNGLPDSLQIVNLAGEPLQTSLVDQIYQQTKAQKVYDLYGPSEDTTYSTFAIRHPAQPATIGRPVANTQVYLLDRNMEPVPTGVPGELHLGGAGLARGYLNRPELNAEKFVVSPFSRDPGARLYKTGDLARYFADGNIEYLGRLDHQVKVRGFRIELGEIETVLNQHPAVRESVVVAHENSSGIKNLVAYVVSHKGSDPTILELREFLKEKLPHFMVPTYVVMLEFLPLTPNGKVDRKALPEPEPTGSVSFERFVAPRDTLENELTKIWEEVLKVQPIGVTENFFEIGGHSLLAVRLFAQIEKKYDRQFPLATLFQAPTIELLASIMRGDQQKETTTTLTSLVTIQPDGSKPPFFCIHARGGNVLFYRDLAKRLGSDQPFYGLQAQGMDGKRPRHKVVEEMAAHYIKEIKTVQPVGPYFLGGASFGGTAAFEMAQQLRAEGEEVALLALFDTTGPDYPKLLPGTTRIRSRIYEFAERIEYQVNCLRLLGPDERGKYVKQKLNKLKVRTIRSLNKRSRTLGAKFSPRLRRLIFPRVTNSPWALLEQDDAIRQAIKDYVPQPYSGRLTLFRANRQPHGIYPDPTLGWRELVTGELVIHEVQGLHGTIVAEPHVRFLAEKLLICIEEALREFAVDDKRLMPEMPKVGRSAMERQLLEVGA